MGKNTAETRRRKVGGGEGSRKGGSFVSRLLGRKRSPGGSIGRPVNTSVRELPDEPARDPGEVYRSLVNHIGIGVFRTTPGIAGRFLELNPAMERITGYSREELLQMNVADLYVRPEERPELVRRVLSGEHAGPAETLFKKKDGTVITVRDTKLAVSSDDGAAIYLQGFLEDITERKKVESALADSERKFKTLAEQSPNMIFINKNGRVMYANKKCAEVTGYSQEELCGPDFSFWRLVAPGSEGTVQRNYGAHREGHEVDPYDYSLVTKDGRIVECILASKIIDYDGGPAILGTVTDITERKKAEEALLFSDSALRSIHEGVIAMDEKFVVTRWNEICEKMFGVKASDAIGKPIGESISMVEQYAGQNRERIDLLIARGYNREEQLYRCPAGDVWVDVHAQAIESGGKRYGWVTLVADTTERKRAEEGLRQSEEKLRRIFQAVAEGVAVVDTDGIVTEVNNALLPMYGLKSREDLIGKRFREIVAPEDHERMRRSLTPVLDQGVVSNVDLTGLRPDGQRISTEVSIGLLRDNSGKPAGSVVTIRDLTESKRMQEQLLAQNRLASIGELVSGVAHEINNPLTSVIGLSELLQQQEIPDDIKEDLSVISQEARRAALIIRDLLTFARKHPATKQPAKIDSIVEDVLRLRAYEHSVNNIEVVRRFATDLPDVTVDHHQMQQVFLNVIVNAEYFMAEAHKRGRLTIATEKVDGMVRVSFADDGPGISPADLARVFDPFFTTKDIGKGTGLGLSICHGIVSEHGGRIYATSEPGEGATFVVELPLDPPELD